jgi:hypothetical protein
LCGWVALAVFDQEIPKLRFEPHPRVFFEDFLKNLRRHLIKAQTQKVETGAEMDQRYLARQPGRYSRRGVQGDRLPNQIRALRRDLMLRAEIARGIRAIYFKPIIATVGRDQPEVVQKRGAKRGFFISHRTAEASDGKTAENVGSKTMRAEKFGRTGFQKVHRGYAQCGIWNSNAGNRFQAGQGHLSLPGLSHPSMPMAACRRASGRVGVGVAGSGDILAIGVKLHGGVDLGDEFAYLRTKYVQWVATDRATSRLAPASEGAGQDRLSTRTILQADDSFLR